MAVGSVRGKSRPDIDLKVQHASPPFRWKGAADSQGFAPAAGPLDIQCWIADLPKYMFEETRFCWGMCETDIFGHGLQMR